MISVICIWLYMLFTCYVVGFACVKMISGKTKWHVRGEIGSLYAGIWAVTFQGGALGQRSACPGMLCLSDFISGGICGTIPLVPAYRNTAGAIGGDYIIFAFFLRNVKRHHPLRYGAIPCPEHPVDRGVRGCARSWEPA